MKGRYSIVVETNRAKFTLRINRNITILRGDSATGKTTLIEMVEAYQTQGPDSGVSITCDRPCVVLSGINWESQLAMYNESIVFIDEGSKFVASEDFARAVKHSTNYYVIAVRESLYQLPYSVAEIYGINNNTGRRNKGTSKFFSSNKRLYPDLADSDPSLPELVIVEDSNSGFQFYDALCERLGITCVSAGSKSKIYKMVCNAEEQDILVIADGAAFGPELERLYLYNRSNRSKHIRFFLPESFEYVLLASGIVKSDELPAVFADPAAFIESKDYVSWERFFTSLLTRLTRDSYLHYRKSHLNKSYLNDREVNSIVNEMTKEGLGVLVGKQI